MYGTAWLLENSKKKSFDVCCAMQDNEMKEIV